MPAQSPTLSPTLSAMVAALRGSSSGNAGLDLAHHVAADVGALGEDAAAETGEDRDQRGAEAQRDQASRPLRGWWFSRPSGAGQDGVVAGDADQGEARHQHAGDRAGAERQRQALGQALGGRLGGAHVGAHRDQHAGEAGRARQHRADQEADGRAAGRSGRRRRPGSPRRPCRWWCTAGADRPARPPGWRRRSPASSRCRARPAAARRSARRRRARPAGRRRSPASKSNSCRAHPFAIARRGIDRPRYDDTAPARSQPQFSQDDRGALS